MATNFRKWKFKPNNRIFISERRLSRLISKKKVTIYDTRPNIDFKKNSFKTSKNKSVFEIKSAIRKHERRALIVLVGPNLRSNASTASWARYEGFKRIYLAPQVIEKIKKREMLKKK